MAKTSLNENVDKFFKSHKLADITENSIKNELKIKDTNDYGNILHAIINYKYDEASVLRAIEILLNLGVDPNYRGKSTGMTFIHLVFYGYTDDNNVDHSYSEDFIIKLIALAKNHGFDVNIKDNDDETPAVAAIASEIYTGSISKIIAALGSEVILDEEFKENFEEYLSDSKSNPSWNKRLLNEKEKIYKLIEAANISLEDIEKEISSCTNDLTGMTTDLKYVNLKNTYKDISEKIRNLISLLKKREVFEVKDNNTTEKINSIVSTISDCLTSEIDSIRTNPNSSRIEEIKPILQEFLLSELIDILNEIENDYHDYQDSLRTSAKNIRTIKEGKNFLEEIKGIEIENELKELVSSIVDSITVVITALKNCIAENKKSFTVISSFTDEEYKEETPDYDNLTKEEIEEKISEINERTSSYREYVFNYLTKTFDSLSSSIAPILESGLINEDDIKNCLIKSLTKKNQGENKTYGSSQD